MRHQQRKIERLQDLGSRIHALKIKGPELPLAYIAQRLGYSATHVGAIYRAWKKNIAGAGSSRHDEAVICKP